MTDEVENNSNLNENNQDPDANRNDDIQIDNQINATQEIRINNVERPRIDITQMVQNGQENRRRDITTMQNRQENNSYDGSSLSSNSTRRRNIIELLDDSNLNRKKFTQLTQLTLSDLAVESSAANRKGYLDLQFLRVISNGRSKQQNQVRYYKANDSSKKMNAVGYKGLY